MLNETRARRATAERQHEMPLALGDTWTCNPLAQAEAEDVSCRWVDLPRHRIYKHMLAFLADRDLCALYGMPEVSPLDVINQYLMMCGFIIETLLPMAPATDRRGFPAATMLRQGRDSMGSCFGPNPYPVKIIPHTAHRQGSPTDLDASSYTYVMMADTIHPTTPNLATYRAYLGVDLRLRLGLPSDEA